MFYSHTFLAKKGPLGAVWIAAHLQHKLRKSHVAVTDISSTVDCIMFPEVPIALRLSGHLLLGVVRIYSKKVDYLYHDCNEVLSQMRTMFASVHVNLPEDADRATFQAVTLPDAFELDALEFDKEYLEETPDKHRKALEQITLPDQIPIEWEYVAILVNEDRFDSTPSPAERPNPSPSAGHEETLPLQGAANSPFPSHMPAGDITDGSLQPSADQAMGSPSPIEVIRIAAHTPDNSGIAGLETDVLAPEGSIDWSGNKKRSLTPEGNIDWSGVKKCSNSTNIPLPKPMEDPLSFCMPRESPAVAPFAFGGQSPGLSPDAQSLDLQLPSSPLVRRPNVRRRRKMFFDASIVLSNAEMKRRLDDTSKIVRKRRHKPSTVLEVWKFQKRMKADQMFNEPLLNGMCTELQDVYDRSFPTATDISSPNSIDETDVDMASSGQSRMQDHDPTATDMEIEQTRCNAPHSQDLPEQMMPSFERERTPFDARTSSISVSPSKRVRTPEFDLPSTLEVPGSAELVDDRSKASSANVEESLVPEMGLSPEVPGLLNSPEEDLLFLNEENTPSPSSSGYKSTRFGSMSSRTRLVAQYYKDQSPVTQSSNHQTGYLSVNKILEGKKRKQCARMFFETLVLKSCGLVDVEQDEAYGDITVSTTQNLSKVAL